MPPYLGFTCGRSTRGLALPEGVPVPAHRFSNTEAQSDRGLFILSPYLGISVFYFFAGDCGLSPR